MIDSTHPSSSERENDALFHVSKFVVTLEKYILCCSWYPTGLEYSEADGHACFMVVGKAVHKLLKNFTYIHVYVIQDSLFFNLSFCISVLKWTVYEN